MERERFIYTESGLCLDGWWTNDEDAIERAKELAKERNAPVEIRRHPAAATHHVMPDGTVGTGMTPAHEARYDAYWAEIVAKTRPTA